MKKFIRRHRVSPAILAIGFLLSFGTTAVFGGPPASPSAPERILLHGKESLDAKDYRKAIEQLTGALTAVPLLADYALLWRAQALDGNGEALKALADLDTLGKNHADSPLRRKALRLEIEIRTRLADPLLEEAMERSVRDYPSETDVKFSYALHLKKVSRQKEAGKLFKEVYLAPSPLSKRALAELLPSEITAEDLLRRGRNLNNAWQFDEAEATFREALGKCRPSLKGQILDGLGYSLFRQKRYRESAEVFGKIQAPYWLARSLLRAGDMEQFESLLPRFMKSTDNRLGQVILDYGTRKRRDGSLETALAVYDTVLSRYPSMREDVLWAKAWAHYLSRDYDTTRALLTELAKTSKESRYRYWRARTAGLLEETGLHPATAGAAPEHRDFYGYLSALETERTVRGPQKAGGGTSSVPPPSERVDLLMRAGLTQEAASEAVHLSKKNGDSRIVRSLSVYLHRLDDFAASVALAAKLPYSDDLHEILYPLAFRQEVEEAGRLTGLDPLLILAVIREESRYDAGARSIAGALGLMQLMPATAQRLSAQADVKLRGSEDLFDRRTNILLGSSYLKTLLATFTSLPAALAAYNAGEHNVSEWLRRGSYRTSAEFIEDIPFSETRAYVKKVLTTYFEHLRAAGDYGLARARAQMGAL